MAPRNVQFALALRSAVTELAQASNKLESLFATYWDSSYSTITDNDLASHDLTAAQITAAITLAENLAKFLNNQVPAQADYSATINAMRSL